MLAPAGVPLNLTAIFNNPTPGFVAFSVYDDTGVAPVLLLSPVLMARVVGNAYRAQFTPGSPGKLYIVFMAVYTDGTFTTLDSAFAAQEQAVTVQPQYLSPPVQSVIGVVGGDDCEENPVFAVYQGDSKTLYLRAVNGSIGGNPLDLTYCTEIVITLPNADGTSTLLKLSLAQVVITQPPVLGGFSAPVSSVLSALLNVGELQTFVVTFTIAGQTFTVQYLHALFVFDVQ